MTAIVAALLLTAAAVGLDGWLLHSDRAADVLTPDPQRVVQNFVVTVAARRPEAATQYLAAEDAGTVRELRELGDALLAHHGDFRFADSEVERTGDTAEVRAHLRTARDKTLQRRFRLIRDPRTRLWKIAEFDLRA